MREQCKQWLQERHENCVRIAAQNTGADKAGWIEDAAYFAEALASIAALENAANDADIWFAQSLRQWRSLSNESSEDRDIEHDNDAEAKTYRICLDSAAKLRRTLEN